MLNMDGSHPKLSFIKKKKKKIKNYRHSKLRAIKEAAIKILAS